MAKKYCNSCGQPMKKNDEICSHCNTVYQETKVQMEKKNQKNNKKGCLIIFIFAFIIFGIPLIAMQTGILDTENGQAIIMIIILFIVNIGLFYWRKSIEPNTEKFYNLSIKTDNNTKETN